MSDKAVEILLATGNPGKAAEMREILANVPGAIRFRLLAEFGDCDEPVEDGDDFLANATIKAHYYAKLSGLWTIADDSGLEVDVLNGEPGVHSARYGGEPKSDANNNRKLIENLQDVSPQKRTARFRCAVVLSDGQSVLASASGAVEGKIIDEPRGHNGFGYDPHFLVESAGKTAAEMTSEEKHAISHRGQALRELRRHLNKLLPKD